MPGFLVFLLLLLLTAWMRTREPAEGWREALVRAALVWGTGIALGSEILGVFSALAFWPVFVLWLAACGFVGWQLWRAPRTPLVWKKPDLTPLEWGLAVATAVPLLLALVTAFAAPPNTPDALAYHLPRQLMWLQQHNLAHFVTRDDRALMMPPFAEIVQAHAMLLSGGDGWANFPQWISWLLSVVVASLIARETGGSRRTQWAAALICATLPMAYLEASSAKNDLFVAAWLAVLAWQGLRLRSAAVPKLTDWLAAGAAAGLALETKTTALIFIPPVLILLIPLGLRQLRLALLGAALGLAIVAPHAMRNYTWYGTPLGIHKAEDGGAQGNELFTPRATVSNLVRNATLHLVTPWPAVNTELEGAVLAFHRWIHLDPDDRRTTLWILHYGLSWGPNYETVAGAPAQFILGGLVLIALFAGGPWRGSLAITGWFMLLGIVLFAVALKWQPWGARLQLPTFLLAAPLIACVAERMGQGGIMAACGLCVLGWLPSAETADRMLWGKTSLLAHSRWENYFPLEPIDGRLQDTTVEALVASGARSLQVRTQHGYLYPLMTRFLAEAGPGATLHGAVSGPTSTPADAVVLMEPFGLGSPLYYTGPGSSGRYRAVGATDPYRIFMPEDKARAVAARIGLPSFVGWDRDENFGLIGFRPLPERLAPLRQLIAPEAKLFFARSAPQMHLRIIAHNGEKVPVRLELRLDHWLLTTLTYPAADGQPSVANDIHFAPLNPQGEMSLSLPDYQDKGKALPLLVISSLQVLDDEPKAEAAK